MIRSFAQHKTVNEQTRRTNQGYPHSLLTKTIVSLANCSIYYRVNHRHNRHCRAPDVRVVNRGGRFCLTIKGKSNEGNHLRQRTTDRNGARK